MGMFLLHVIILNANIPLLERKCPPLKRKLSGTMANNCDYFLFINIFYPKYMALLSHETQEQMAVTRYNTHKYY